MAHFLVAVGRQAQEHQVDAAEVDVSESADGMTERTEE
jgi:hypothetical protein